MGFSSFAVVLWSAAFALLAVSAATDIKDRRIPDQAAIAVAAIGLALALSVRPGSVWLTLVVACAVFLGLAVLSHYRIIGGGDLKLITAVTLLVPPSHVGRLLVDIAFAGGVLSCLYLAARSRLRMQASPETSPTARRGLAAVVSTERGRILAGGPMPYALAIFGGVCVYAANEVGSCSFAFSCSP